MSDSAYTIRPKERTDSPNRFEFPLFPVATHKFVVLSVCTLGFYELYWCYQNWKRLKGASNLSPFWRAFFAPLWNFSLFNRVQNLAQSDGHAVAWSGGVLAAAYFVLQGCWQLRDPWWLVTLATVLPIIPVQRAAQRLNERCAASVPEDLNERYGGANVATIVIGGLFLVLVVIGTLAGEPEAG